MPLRKKKSEMSQRGGVAPRPVRRKHRHLWIDMMDRNRNTVTVCEVCKRRKL